MICCALVALAPATAHAALETVLQDDATFLYRTPAQVRASMREVRRLGVDRVRLTANWAILTRDADAAHRPGSFDARDPAAYEQARWRGLDQAVRLARAAGLKVLIDIGYHAPHWATTDRSGERARTHVSAAAYADFAVATASRYSGSFVVPTTPAPPPPPGQDQTFLDALLGGTDPATAPPPPAGRPLPAVDQFALWNEPNHPAFLMPQWTGKGSATRPASPVLYARMVRAAYPAAKAVRPDATFLVGNTSSIGDGSHRAVGPLRFIRELACVDARLRPRTTGACANFTPLPGDGWAHHPYTGNRRPDRDFGPGLRDDAPLAGLGRLAALLRRLVAMGRLAPDSSGCTSPSSATRRTASARAPC